MLREWRVTGPQAQLDATRAPAPDQEDDGEHRSDGRHHEDRVVGPLPAELSAWAVAAVPTRGPGGAVEFPAFAAVAGLTDQRRPTHGEIEEAGAYRDGDRGAQEVVVPAPANATLGSGPLGRQTR